MLIFHKIRLFFVSRSTILFLKVFFISLPISFFVIYFVFYSDYGIRLFNKMAKTRPLIEKILYEPINHNSNTIYPPDQLRSLRDFNTYQKPDVLWEGTAIDPLYELPKTGSPKTPRGL